MMRAIQERGLVNSIYLWSDDNLSNNYYHRYLSEETREFVANYASYGRVCCFKGFDADSFSFNTRAAPELFGRQFQLFDALLNEGLDLYAYVTLTAVNPSQIPKAIPQFVDRLQSIHHNLPLRTVPLEIQNYSPLGSRMTSDHNEAMRNQWIACEAWQRELERRFSAEERNRRITEIHLGLPVA
jgi:hypothetical protein